MITEQERREFIRLEAHTDVEFKILNHDETLTGETIDLSGSGLSFRSPIAIAVGVILEVKVKPFGLYVKSPLHMLLEVTRCQPEHGRPADRFIIAGRMKSAS